MFYLRLPIIILVDLCLGEKVASRVGAGASGPHRSSAGYGGRGVSLDMSNTGNISYRDHDGIFGIKRFISLYTVSTKNAT